MDITIKNLGNSITGDHVYRIYPRGYHLDIGDAVKRSDGRWCAQPAVRGEARPSSSWTHHSTRREAIARLVAHADDATK